MKPLFLALFLAVCSSLQMRVEAQGVNSVAILPNPAYTNTPITVLIEYYLANGCISYSGYTQSWQGNTLNIYLNFNSNGGPFCPQIYIVGDEILDLGTLAAGTYTVRIFDFDLSGGLLATQNFTVFGINNCPVPTGLSTSYVHYSVFTLQWNSVAGAVGYRTRVRAPGGAWIEEADCDNQLNTTWYNATPNTPYECQVRACCASGESDWSSSIIVTTLGAGDPYCYSYGNSSFEWIQSVQFGSINNTSGNNYGYRNYTSLSTTVQKGQSYPITVTPGNADANDVVNWRIWIDFNKDNDFNDTGELVVSATGNDQTPLNTTIAIPTTAGTGVTRMRIMMAYSSVNGPCDQLNFRDIEDYNISILPGTVCQVPTGLTQSYNHYSVFTLQWNSVAGAVGYRTRIRPAGGTWIEETDCYNQLSTTWYNVVPNTQYECQVRTCCTSGESDWSPGFFLTTLGAGDPYCYSYGNSTYEWIQSVLFGSINNNSGNNYGYRNYTNLSTTVLRGQSYPVTVTPGNADANDVVNWRIWIDFNKDNDFNDTGELVVSTTGNDQAPLNTSIVIPTTASTGVTRMRIMMAYSPISGPCDQLSFRDVEDYSVNIQAPVLSVSPSSMNFPASGGSQTLAVTSNCVAWTVTGAPSWLTVSPTGGSNNGSVSVSAQNNASTQSRTATLTISGCGVTQTVTVSQNGASPILTVSPTSLTFSATGGSQTLTITSNCSVWTVTGAPSWLTVSPTVGSNNGSVSVSAQNNASTQSRSATLTVSGCGVTQIVSVTQNGASPILTVTPTNMTFSATGGSQTLTITSNCSAWTVTGAPSWLTVSPSIGSNNGSVSISAQNNASTQPRSATLTISGCGVTQIVTVSQNGASPILTVSPTNLTFSASGGSQTLAITSNCSAWVITGAPSWLTVSPSSGSNNGSISVSAQNNASTQSRSATLTISGCGVTQIVTVSQNGASIFITLFPSPLTFTAAGGSQAFTVVSNCTSWSITSVPGWLIVSPSSGGNNATITVTCQVNNTSQSRSGLLTVSGCGVTSTLAITQSGANATLTASPTNLNFIAPGGSQTFMVTSNCVSWSISGVPSWLSLSATSGSNNATITVLAQNNTTAQSRSATLTISGCGLTQTIVVTQNADVQVPWVTEVTGENHTIILPGTLSSGVLEPGDAIGFFYNKNGSLTCGGYGIWPGPGQATSFAVYGNDDVFPDKNGFAIGEVFTIRIWQSALNQVVDGAATYAPVGTGGIVTHTNAYASNGISMLTDVSAITTAQQSINLANGWNIISSYIISDNPDMLDVFSDISSQVLIIKNGAGASAIPSFNSNNIGDWSVIEGYQVKCSQATTLVVEGLKVFPENTPIPLNTGWQLIAYLRDNPQNAALAFSSIQNQISIVKNNNGDNLIPQFGINTIGNLIPGQGYKVKAIAPVTLNFSANFKGDDDEAKATTKALSQHFILDSTLNTGNNSTIILPFSAASAWLQEYDEIGIFTGEGVLCGTAVFSNENLALTVWGDDATTANVKEGMQPGEMYVVKIWKANTQLEHLAIAAFEVGDGLYQPDDIEVIESMQLLTSEHEARNSEFSVIRTYPNPVTDIIRVSILTQKQPEASFVIYRPDGSILTALPDVELPVGQSETVIQLPASVTAGLYVLRIATKEGMWFGKLIVGQ